MSVLLPHDLNWGVANWVSFGFFKDSLPYLDQAPHLAEDIRFCIDAEVDTLDLRGAGRDKIQELKRLVTAVLEQSRATGEAGFSEPAMHPTYVAKLEELAATVDCAMNPRRG
jgi:hypothetical protein